MGPIDNAEAAKRPNQNKRDNKIEPEKKEGKQKDYRIMLIARLNWNWLLGPAMASPAPTDRLTTMRERKHRVVW